MYLEIFVEIDTKLKKNEVWIETFATFSARDF